MPACTISKEGTKWPGLDFIQKQIEDVDPGAYRVAERVEVMDRMSVDAQIVYPNILGFGGQKAVEVDSQLRLYPVDNIDTALAGLSEEVKVKVLSGNAAKLYNIAV